MAHYAFIDDNNIVVGVIVGRDENEFDIDWEDYYGSVRGLRCLRTSYNTYGNKHSSNGTPFRKNYAGIGFTYDEARDAFIPPKPFPSWTLDEDSCTWLPPKPQTDPFTQWDESKGDWVSASQS